MSLARDPAYSRTITAPVLLVVGDHDMLSCDTAAGLPCSTAKQICARERGFYPPGAPLYAAVVPNAGHSINGHGTAPAQYALINAWTRAATTQHAATWPRCQV
ncbi:hypothetical protein AB0M46_05815 [Dactylosporangium sp. NPDC051485]|uniref:hypothetical protein n=1 Tax=Dactylosporangium sp. NPDC051485 TaxID=3154846 RepID=UPI003436B226